MADIMNKRQVYQKIYSILWDKLKSGEYSLREGVTKSQVAKKIEGYYRTASDNIGGIMQWAFEQVEERGLLVRRHAESPVVLDIHRGTLESPLVCQVLAEQDERAMTR